MKFNVKVERKQFTKFNQKNARLERGRNYYRRF